MKTDLHLLWIDDNKDFVEALKPRLEKWMDGHGFGLSIRFQKNSVGVVQMLRDEDIAFVVLDYHLGKKTGDMIIDELRKAELYQDIIFYSQDLKREDFPTVDGVFFVNRGDAETRIKNLLALKVRAASDFATFRGWMLADSIELEIILGRILAKCFGSHEQVFGARVLAHENLFDFYKKHQVLNGIIKDRIAELSKEGKPGAKALSECKKLLDQFPDDIIHPRNALAHQPSEDHEKGKRIKTRAKNENREIINTPESLVVIRQKIRRHRENLVALETLV